MAKSINSRIRKYFLACSILGGALILLWLILSSAIQNYTYELILVLIIVVSIKFAVRIISNKTLLPVLFKDLDAIGFQEIMNNKHLAPPSIYRSIAAISVGDYKTTVNIASKQLRNPKIHMRLKYYYLGLLARVYFERRDTEKLRLVVAQYEELKASCTLRSRSMTSSSMWCYYRHFLEHNYDACKTVCNESNIRLNHKATDANSKRLLNDFAYAVACYEGNEREEAKAIFERIVSYAPRMYIAIISQKYLKAINCDQDLSIFGDDILPDDCQD